MGLDATVPLDAPEFRFKRIRVPGERDLELASVLDDASAIEAWRDRLISRALTPYTNGLGV
jgi:2,5-furandicarboxylate decarboxylase 1